LHQFSLGPIKKPAEADFFGYISYSK